LKIIYYCECCQDILEEMELPETAPGDTLTEDKDHDIINLQQMPRLVYLKSLCDECFSALGEDGDLRLFTSKVH